MVTEILNERELCHRLGVTRWALIQWRKAGLPYLRFKQTIRYDWGKVQAWAERRARRAEAAAK